MTQSTRTYFPTSHVGIADNYPYGRLRTTAYFGTEFVVKKGFRSTFQTINPKTGRTNAIKKDTYNPIEMMYQDSETGYYRHVAYQLDGDESITKAAAFCNKVFLLFTTTELRHIYAYMLLASRGSMKASIAYNGAKAEALKPLYEGTIAAITEGYEAICKGERVNTFDRIVLDHEAIKACGDPDYQPFKVTSSFRIGGNGMEQIPLEA